MRLHTLRHDLAIFGLLFLLPLILFGPQTVGGRTLLPTENLYQYEPYATYREVVKAPAVPHNALLSDLILQNYPWKTFIRAQFAQGEIPLWNPHNFSGTPFMAAGQQSTLYPLSLIYYLMPLTAAYGWFTVVNLWLAGVFMFLLVRGYHGSRFGATLAAISYQLCGMFIASAVHPMIIGAVVWLPLILLMIEYVIRQRPLFNRPASAPWAGIGALALAGNILAGHAELTIYTLLIAAYYAGMRLLLLLWQTRREPGALRHLVQRGGWIAALVLLGLGLGAVQLVPLYDFVRTNWRAERTDLATVLTYGHPFRDLIQFLIPNFYGSPAHHTYFDLFTRQTVDIGFVNSAGEFRTHTDWGIKNYVEGALYLGILPLVLATFAVMAGVVERVRRNPSLTLPVNREGTGSIHPPDAALTGPALTPDSVEKSGIATQPLPRQRGRLGGGAGGVILIYTLLILVSLTFMFGLPTYALIYPLPGINQLNTPFRWIYGVTIGVSVLAGFGADALLRHRIAARRTGLVLATAGLLTLAGLGLSRLLYPQLETVLARLLDSLANASLAFDSPAMFYSYQFVNGLIFGLMTLGAGIVLIGLRGDGERLTPVKLFAVGLVAVDLLIASWGFNPASDPLLLDFTPPVIQWLQEQAAADPESWRVLAVNNAVDRDILPANALLPYGLDEVTGYDSIIAAQYVAYMRELAPQRLLDQNRISPLYTAESYDLNSLVTSLRFRQLNVKYLITHKSTSFATALIPDTVRIVYEDEAVRVWEVPHDPRFYTLSAAALLNPAPRDVFERGTPPELLSNTGRELLLNVTIDAPAWLIISQTYAPGWKAFIRPPDAAEDSERELTVELVQENFQGVTLPEAGTWTVRLIYSPPAFQVGVFGTIISGAVLLLVVGIWFWQRFIARQSAEDSSSAARLARNSVAPIILNLFNRSLDLVFAAVMFRLLGPERAGFYYYAIAIFGWFDILTNFGLDVYLMREAGRQRDRADFLFLNTRILRYTLVAAGIPLLIAFIAIRQAAADPLHPDVLLTIALFYVGLVPGSLSKGLTSLFYAFEQAEYPAAVTTITTICRVAFGLLALLLGYGIVGLAGVSIITNLITLLILGYASRRIFARMRQGQSRRDEPAAQANVNPGLLRGMTSASFPLMLNHLLATIFFQIDIVIMEGVRGARMVGLYRTAYSWLLAINVIPAFFTQALMPVMARQWQADPVTFRRTYILAIKLLTGIAFPLAVAFTVLAEPLTLILGGTAYLPDGAIALQIMIWSIPIGWMNSLTQYALVAVDFQRRITGAFVVAVLFNIITNLILIPPYGYQAAALTTIASEGVLWVAFARLMAQALTQRGAGALPWLDLLWRQAAAAGVMLGIAFLLLMILPGWTLLAALAGGVVYLIVLVLLRPLSAAELAFLVPHLPLRLRQNRFSRAES